MCCPSLLVKFPCYSGRQPYAGVRLFETIFLGWAFLQATCFLEKGRDSRSGTQILDFLEERGIETEWWTYHNGNLSWSVFKFFVFVCEVSVNENGVIVCNYKTITQNGSFSSIYSLRWIHAYRRVYEVF